MTFNCNSLSYDIPNRPPGVPSCYIFVLSACTFVEPPCPNQNQSILVFGVPSAPQCICGQPIENCLFYLRNPAPVISLYYPLVCGVCDFLYTPSSTGISCVLLEKYTVSFFTGQVGTGAVGGPEGVFNGHLVGSRTARTFSLVLDPWASLVANYVTDWNIKRYSYQGAIFYTISQMIPNANPNLSPSVYLYKAPNSSTVSSISGFQLRPASLSQPTFDIMFRIVYSKDLLTQFYYVGAIFDFSGQNYINENFALTGGVPTTYPTRFYANSHFEN